MSQLPRRASAALASLVVVLGLAACAPASATSSGGESVDCSAAVATPLSEIAESSGDATGPATACLVDSDVPAPQVAPEPELPATVTDVQGTTVTVTDTSRILALDVSGTLASTVYSLGLGDSLVGRDVATSFPGSDELPLVTGSGHDLNGEAILGLAPTVLLTDSSVGPWDTVLQVRDAGIPVVVVTPERSMDNVGDLTMAIATALGVPEAGEALVDEVDRRLDEVQDQIDRIAPAAADDKVRMIFLYVRGAANVYYVFGEGSGADSLITRLGGIDVAAEVGIANARPITAESLVAAAPDLVLVMTKGLASVNGVDGLLEAVPALAQTPAGADRRIVDMADSEILGFGPRSPAVLEALARAIYAPAS
ncbi:hemin ABC transporter substrate-binding protein [Herbiconiux sp. L3-i23]|uniref:heme/hemin ABC transporter substrate-binding protein n=1 Tax=Herbiconiux sp. L3-i23 TaxID=2905871 RepID=UPI002045BE10|nr:ABC transporter substrate-binding protein [Herbiconiux sp. L3-i23]BDI23041.1 ABC transporter substrate-binding protein [Herbiconiux sp. L3-i23]